MPDLRPGERPSLQDRLAALAARHGGSWSPPPEPEPDAPPPTEEEAMATLMAAFPDATVEVIQGNG